MSAAPPFDVVLFDLGGVLERVSAAPQIEAWTGGRIPVDGFWTSWLTCQAVRDFETGSISSDTFALRAVRELGLDVAPSRFLDEFRGWLAGPYEGARELVESVRRTGTRTASFSNSNAVHWPIMERHQATMELFDANFPSHRLGLCKPDVEAFARVLKLLGRPGERILFIDDNQMNVDGAREAGLRAERVEGVAGARGALEAAGVLPAVSRS